MSYMVEIDIDFDYCGEVEMILAHDECGEHEDVEFYRNDLLASENVKLRELVQEAVDAASLKDMRDWSYGKRLVFLREARELGIEVGS